jgi:hypothetical protein
MAMLKGWPAPLLFFAGGLYMLRTGQSDISVLLEFLGLWLR